MSSNRIATNNASNMTGKADGQERKVATCVLSANSKLFLHAIAFSIIIRNII